MGLKTVKMAVGMRSSYFAPIVGVAAGGHPEYGDVLDMGAAVKGALSITTAKMQVPGDDIYLIDVEKFASGQFDAETTADDLAINAVVFGHLFNENGETSGKDDAAPSGGYGFIEPFMRKDKSTFFRATFLYNVTAMLSSEKQEGDTRKGSDFTTKNKAISYSVNADDAGSWRQRQEFNTEAEAEAWLRAMFGKDAGYSVRVIVSGNGSVNKPYVFAAAGANVTLTFGSVPAALYDNGSDASSALSGEEYTISSVAADHEIVAIFA